MLDIADTGDLHEQLAVLDGWYDRLGEAGQDFIKTFKAIGTHELYDPDYRPIAAFHGVGLTTFTNAVVYSPRAVARDLHTLFSYRTHEAIHALQAHVCAAIHADPVSKRTPVILCPRDYIKMEILKEHGAYGGQALFNTLIHRLDSGRAENISFKFSALADPENADEIERLKASMRRHVSALFADPGHDLHRHYCDHALARFEMAMADDRRDELARDELRFVRLEAEDIAAAGDGFVLNLFTDADGAPLREYLDDITLPPEIEARVQALNRALGIADENALPTFGQALAAAGSDRVAFATASIAGRPGVPVLRRPGRDSGHDSGPAPAPAPL